MATLEQQDVTLDTVATVDGLHKRYKDVQAVRGLSFHLRAGEIFGLLGPNGAGKTTTIEIMEGLRPYDTGTVRVLGMDPWRQSLALKQRIGAALQSTMIPDKVKAGEVVRLYAGFYDRHVDVDALLDRLDLGEKRNATFDTLSGGQKQRLALALTLVNDPDLVFLDEPTAGLDAQARRDLHAIILNLRDEGKTVLLTTHYIEEADRLCDRVAIIARGQMQAIGTPDDLRTRARREAWVEASFHVPVAREDLGGIDGVLDAQVQRGKARLFTRDAAATVTHLVRALEKWGNALTGITVSQPTLEDLYLELVASPPNADAAGGETP